MSKNSSKPRAGKVQQKPRALHRPPEYVDTIITKDIGHWTSGERSLLARMHPHLRGEM